MLQENTVGYGYKWTHKRSMHVDISLIEENEKRKLLWYGHMRRMSEGRLSQKLWKWQLRTGSKKGRPRRDWNEQVDEAMKKRQLEGMLHPDEQ